MVKKPDSGNTYTHMLFFIMYALSNHKAWEVAID